MKTKGSFNSLQWAEPSLLSTKLVHLTNCLHPQLLFQITMKNLSSIFSKSGKLIYLKSTAIFFIFLVYLENRDWYGRNMILTRYFLPGPSRNNLPRPLPLIKTTLAISIPPQTEFVSGNHILTSNCTKYLPLIPDPKLCVDLANRVKKQKQCTIQDHWTRLC